MIVDRYSKWISIYPAKNETATELITVLKNYFSTFGISSECASDGGPQFVSKEFQSFLKQYGVHHRLASAYHPHSNQLAESAVKIAKRLIRDNTSASGGLNTDAFLASLLGYRNTPDRDTGLSPAQVVFGRAIKEFLPIAPGNLELHPEWRITMEQREVALARRHTARQTTLTEHSKTLVPLELGMVVSVQNQNGNKPKRWDRSGIVVEVKEHDQYLIKMDGTGRPSLRNRQFLCPITPYQPASRGQRSLYQARISLAQPEVSLAQSEVSLVQPEVFLAQPEVSPPQPRVSLANPEVSPPQPLPTLPSSTSRRESKRSLKGQAPSRLITTMA